MFMWYRSVAIMFWQLSFDHIVNAQYKRCGFTKTRLRHPSLPFNSLPYPTRTICSSARLCSSAIKSRIWREGKTPVGANMYALSCRNICFVRGPQYQCLFVWKLHFCLLKCDFSALPIQEIGEKRAKLALGGDYKRKISKNENLYGVVLSLVQSNWFPHGNKNFRVHL